MSAYSRHFVASVKANNKILREHKQDGAPTIYIPFGTEYSILLKNLSTQRAVVKVTIDGTDVLSGKSLIVEANSDFELTRFVDSLSKGNRFKFIEKTEQISDFRGDKIDDGIVRIEYQFEKPVVQIQEVHHHHHHDYNWWGNNTYFRSSFYDGPSCYDGSAGLANNLDLANTVYNSSRVGNDNTLRAKSLNNIQVGSNSGSMLRSLSLGSVTASAAPAPSEDGITVKGSVSEQRFSKGTVGELEDEKHVITLALRGKVADAVVAQPITVSTKIHCTSCGTAHKSSAQFCSKCGTALSIAI